MSKILCVPGDLAREMFPENGVNPGRLDSLCNLIAVRGAWLHRTPELERDPKWRQVATYTLVVRAIGDEYFVKPPCVLSYRRRAKPDQPTLSGAVSIGVGGHVDQADERIGPKTGRLDPLATLVSATYREVSEEIGEVQVQGPCGPKVYSPVDDHPLHIGVLCTDDGAGLYHIGLVNFVKVDWKATSQNGFTVGEILDPKFVFMHHLHDSPDLEPWSRAVLDFLQPPKRRVELRREEEEAMSQALMGKYQQ